MSCIIDFFDKKISCCRDILFELVEEADRRGFRTGIRHLCSPDRGVGNEIVFVTITGKLLGGKGGFGSILKAQGDRMSSKKIRNFDSCKTIDGVKVRSVKQQNNMGKWLEIIKKRKAEKIRNLLEEGTEERRRQVSSFKIENDNEEAFNNLEMSLMSSQTLVLRHYLENKRKENSQYGV